MQGGTQNPSEVARLRELLHEETAVLFRVMHDFRAGGRHDSIHHHYNAIGETQACLAEHIGREASMGLTMEALNAAEDEACQVATR